MAQLRSNTTAMCVLLLALVAQIPHAQYVYYQSSVSKSMFDWIFAVVYAIALELAVLIFVIHGRHTLSWMFALGSVLINLSYYGHIPAHLAELLIAVMLPAAIACYSHMLGVEAHSSIRIGTYLRDRWERLYARGMRVIGRTHSTYADTHIEESVVVVDDDTHIPTPTTDSTHILDDRDREILGAVRVLTDDPERKPTTYAISKMTGINNTVLRKRVDEHTYTGRLPKLVEAGYLRNGGSEYSLVE